MKRILALFLTIFLMIGAFSGCDAIAKLWLEDATGIRDLPYTLNDAMIDGFYSVLEETQTLSIAGEDMDIVDEAVTRLDDAYMALIDQNQIAYIRYCLDQKNKKAQSRYLYATDVVAEAEAAYNAMLKRVYLSDTPVRDELFADWTEDEIDRMLKYDDAIMELEKRNAEILLEFRALEPETRDAQLIPLYNEFVKNNNAMAQIYGYENYYDYAYSVVYSRDYGAQELAQMRAYIGQYLMPAYAQASAEFDNLYRALDTQDQSLLHELLYAAYDQGEINYVHSYLADMPEGAQQAMEQMFSEKRAVFTSYRHAHQGAFTTWIGGKPFCYFGTGYHTVETMIHELGHYYGSQYVEAWSQPMDLSETQSQGNEWLYVAYMDEQLSPMVHQVYCEYKLTVDMANIVAYTMIDSFEEKVYSHERAGELTLQEYDAIMDFVAQDYGGIDYISEELFDIQSYWKRVVIESPVYYISYAVSSVAAMDLFLTAQENEELARQRLCVLMEEPVEDGGFLANIRQAEMPSPFEETVYTKLMERYAN